MSDTNSPKIELSEAQMAEVKMLEEANGNLDALGSALDKLERSKRRGMSRGEKYLAWREEMLDHARAKDALWTGANAPYKAKDIQPGTVYTDQALSNLSVMYGNDEYIGEELMPTLPAARETGKFYTYTQRDRFSEELDDTMGTRGEANEIQESRSEDTFSCVTYGLKNFISQQTIDQQESPMNEFMDATESLSELLAFKREIRCAAVAGVAGSYGANTSALAAADRWDSTGAGLPIKDIQDMLAALWSGRGPGVLRCFSSLDVYNVLSRHQAILDLHKYGGTRPGLATPDMIANYFGIERYLVGRARKDVNDEGASASYSRIWPDVFGVVRVAVSPSIRNASFGYGITYEAGNVTTEYLRRQGLKGGWVVQNTTSYVHKVVAATTGYLKTTVIS